MEKTKTKSNSYYDSELDLDATDASEASILLP